MTVVESKRRKKVKEEKEDEDVCFICFDGGSLVLCDHRDCPKAYHPACVKRDESYFIPEIRWECGWHLCNICLKNAIFLCYTCPYSLCKGCVKEADIYCVRGNKGFCKTCMSTVKLIEKIPQENNELPQVDFDDATCWEYLFKVYWILLKNKEALTLDELIRASNPWKVSALKQKNRDTYLGNSAHLAGNTLKRRKTRKAQPPQPLLTIDSQKIVKAGSNKVPGLLGRPDWASEELLEFVAYMKNGDISSVSEFDVQALLLDYIKNNNLRDPRQKCQIICDKRLENLFGKDRVGHFEMLKLLEYHFKEESSSNGVIHGSAVGPSGLLEEGTTVDIQTSGRNTRQQSRRNGDEGDRRIDPTAYAAIDTHNINLIYLKRSLLETITVDAEKFHDKVVGSVVRIKLSNNDQKQDMHRLVRIIGSSKATQPYKSGDKMENLMLKILNLNKIEDVRIDAISDQDFSEDECRRLRQSIKLGLVERMTVGEIQEKAMVLQSVRVNDRLETEIRKLIHLRDRASELGRRKELREYVEKIELLRTPEERQRRIKVPEVHADPRMDPSCGSDDESGESDMKRRDVAFAPKYSNSYVKSMELISPCGVGNMSKDDRARTLKAAAENGERKRKYSDKFHVVKVEGASGSLGPPQKTERPDAASRVLERDSRTDSSVISGDHGIAAYGSISQCNSDPSRAAPKGMLVVSDVSELEKIWYYQDPSGNVQGPFCMLQLRKWDSNDFFPNDLKVWRVDETCDQSVLLKDALKKQKSGEPHFVQRSCMQSHDGAKIDDGKVNSIGVMNSNSVTSWVSDQTNEECSKSNMTDTACTPGVIEQSVNGYSSQFSKAQLIDSLFNIEEPGSDSTAERSPEMMHVNIKSESSRPLNDTPMSANADVISPAVKIGPPSPNAGRPDSGTNLDIASDGIEVSNLPGSMTVSNHENTKDLRVHQLEDKSDVCKDFNVNGLPSTAPKAEKDCMKYYEAENTHSISFNVLGGSSGTGRNIVSSGMDISLLTRIMPSEELKANGVENKCHAGSNVPQQDSGTSLGSISGGIMVSNLPNISPKSETDGLQTSVTESKGFLTPNIPGQDSGVSWSNMTGGIGFSINDTTPMNLDVNASGDVAVENDHCAPQQVPEQDFSINWADPSSIGAVLDIGDDWDWQPIEFSTLGDESVSDLLSEVEALEAMGGISSPIPEMNCADDSIGSPGHDCFSPLGGLNLNLDLGKNDAFSADIQFHMQPNHRDQPHASFNVDVCDVPGTSGILSTLDPPPPPVPDLNCVSQASLSPPPASLPLHNFVSQAPLPLSLAPSPSPTPVLPTPPSPASKSPSLPAPDSKSPLPPPAPTKLPSPPLSSPQLPPSPTPTAAKAHSPSPNPAAVAVKAPSASPIQGTAAEKSPSSSPQPAAEKSLSPSPSPSPQPSILSLNCSSNPEKGKEVNTNIPAHQGYKRTASIEFSWKQGSETTTSGWEPPGQPTGKFSGTGSSLGSPNMHRTTSGQVTPALGANSPQGTSVVMTSPRYNHNVGRQPGPKDRSHHYNNGTDSGFGKSRPTSWNKPSSFGGRGGPLRPGPPHRGRVCKFHESGYCRKGASCMYLHP